MLNNNLYKACKNAQQRMKGMMDIGIDIPFYNNLTLELDGFVSSFLSNDRHERVLNYYNIMNTDKFDYITELGVAENIPEGWDKAMRYLFAGISDTMVEVGVKKADLHKSVGSYTDLTAAEWICIVLDYTKYLLNNDML